jgi:hypothetical protein
MPYSWVIIDLKTNLKKERNLKTVEAWAMQGHMLKLICRSSNCNDTSCDYNVGKKNYWDLEQTRIIKKTLSL